MNESKYESSWYQLINAVVVVSVAAPFDVSTCGKGKGCFLPNDCVPGAAENVWVLFSKTTSLRKGIAIETEPCLSRLQTGVEGRWGRSPPRVKYMNPGLLDCLLLSAAQRNIHRDGAVRDDKWRCLLCCCRILGRYQDGLHHYMFRLKYDIFPYSERMVKTFILF